MSTSPPHEYGDSTMHTSLGLAPGNPLPENVAMLGAWVLEAAGCSHPPALISPEQTPPAQLAHWLSKGLQPMLRACWKAGVMDQANGERTSIRRQAQGKVLLRGRHVN